MKNCFLTIVAILAGSSIVFAQGNLSDVLSNGIGNESNVNQKDF